MKVARRMSVVPDGLTHWAELTARLRDRRWALLFDFDGTLADIADDPAAVSLPDARRRTLRELARRCPVAVLSGRDLRDVRQRVGIGELWFAGSHGFELAGPDGGLSTHPAGEAVLPDLDEAERQVSRELHGIAGALVDRKRFALAVHYRNVDPDAVDDLTRLVRGVGATLPSLKVTHGRLVIELLPNVDWNKGRALLWLLDRLTPGVDVLALYAGDDLTDEDALYAVRDTGMGIVVRSTEHGDRATWAHYGVDGPDALGVLLARIASLAAERETG